MPKTLSLLRSDHRNFARVLAVLERQIRDAKDGRPVATPLISMILTYFREYPRKVHHPKEDLIYSALALRAPDEAATAFHALQDHRDLFDRLEPMEQAVRTLDDESGAGLEIFCHQAHMFIEKQRQHMALEEAQLFPRAAALLSANDWSVIDRFMASDEDLVFGVATSAPFDKLRAAIEEIDHILDALPLSAKVPSTF
jgi:hemerythrin-like domain-containing protein